MKIGFYPRLALDGIRKNRRLCFPYIMTCAGMIAMFYIICYLQYCEATGGLYGESILREVFALGTGVIAVFACIFLFYTNSFLMKRRKREFGLYNILGMGKRNLALIVLWETLIMAALSLWIGLFGGIVFSKFAELILVKILGGAATYSFEIPLKSITSVLTVFLAIFLLLLLNSVRQICFSSTQALLKSESAGEKPPKANWFWGIAGAALLAGAYYLAVTTTNPLEVFFIFFVAVIMVIIGTYMLMISGSVLICKILQRDKHFYYRPNNFVAVSSMTYRMKRNGAGLASICILATMVLVMISSTASLYFGFESAIWLHYPRSINVCAFLDSFDYLSDNKDKILEAVQSAAENSGARQDNIMDYRAAGVAGYVKNGVVDTDASGYNAFDTVEVSKGLFQFYFVPLEDYNRMTGLSETLGEKEAIMYIYRGEYDLDEISFRNGETIKIVKEIDDFPLGGDSVVMIVPSMVLIVPDVGDALGGLVNLADYAGGRLVSEQWLYGFDVDLGSEEEEELAKKIFNYITDRAGISLRASISSRKSARATDMALYGGLFYIGILLSAVFIFAAVLIIYYKQISEGYEDQSRFEIMQKVGMTDADIRKSIKSQLLTVFFLPLALAGLHLIFAFPIIRKLLLVFNLNNLLLFAAVTAICFAIFALLYAAVYRITSNAYYNIVSGAKERQG